MSLHFYKRQETSFFKDTFWLMAWFQYVVAKSQSLDMHRGFELLRDILEIFEWKFD